MIPGQRLKMTTPKAGATFKQAAHVTRRSRIVGVTLFIDTPDAGDTVDVRIGDRTVVDGLHVDLQSNASYTSSFAEEANPGTQIVMSYFSAGTSTKTVSWAAKAVALIQPGTP